MGLFKNKSCPACGGKLGILSFRVADGVKICSACETMLDEAEQKVAKLAKGADGAPVESAFNGEAEGNGR